MQLQELDNSNALVHIVLYYVDSQWCEHFADNAYLMIALTGRVLPKFGKKSET